ncbi:hypothetical protein HRR83_000010 [Exophiala dermatitidis]|uniref:Uncharacterized protein n=1 Tax=Exophiala dermatitidis TaxID=5970 RepID=A0AAN6F434_EXODE|nr:hypothetical protein HRR73_002543 [Exophiala dermatitidis]KAJ4524421.1 hypothetical protein HRR75_000009 [Exophiala dermatitidis]KAJ4527258.1 hypothetical protein HRR74_000010 [Exophiala dermatitidis]KAJ4530811.1 hypothetical protein HRR76_008506 [Exophiala dermatitidis]KAJ4549730.1 hypothetical protein HRR78_004539 [Exophiala dermatitidis]
MASTPTPSRSRSIPVQSKPKPWYRYITLDLLLLILANSIFHPWISLIFYLCLASVHKHREPLAYYTLYYTAALAVVECAIWINHRVAHGPHRKVDWENEVAVVTGGGSGLGRVIAQMLVRKGVKVAIWDVKEPDAEALDEMERWDLVWHQVDVARLDEVQRAMDRVVDELGSPTILINNAATTVSALPLVSTLKNPSSLSPEQASGTLEVNTLSHFNTLSVLLPRLIASAKGAHIVTISSILSHLAPACLADYAMSKAAVSSLHQTLCHELRNHPDPTVFARVKTLLVEPGQLDTQLFADITSVPFYAHFFGPVLAAKDVAKDIARTIERGDGGVLRSPFYAKCMPLYGALPGSLQLLMRWFSGIDRAIVGRDKKTS